MTSSVIAAMPTPLHRPLDSSAEAQTPSGIPALYARADELYRLLTSTSNAEAMAPGVAEFLATAQPEVCALAIARYVRFMRASGESIEKLFGHLGRVAEAVDYYSTVNPPTDPQLAHRVRSLLLSGLTAAYYGGGAGSTLESAPQASTRAIPLRLVSSEPNESIAKKAGGGAA